ncbi:hypothetical protein R3P38DRAFT_3195794 [Favolaschia claudopus]|uniref:Uncharacterized protein n=1 Tax=Favolaschia claudopus TaxID=2862362 RepID=A0AAW0B8J7_9AGAR
MSGADALGFRQIIDLQIHPVLSSIYPTGYRLARERQQSRHSLVDALDALRQTSSSLIRLILSFMKFRRFVVGQENVKRPSRALKEQKGFRRPFRRRNPSLRSSLSRSDRIKSVRGYLDATVLAFAGSALCSCVYDYHRAIINVAKDEVRGDFAQAVGPTVSGVVLLGVMGMIRVGSTGSLAHSRWADWECGDTEYLQGQRRSDYARDSILVIKPFRHLAVPQNLREMLFSGTNEAERLSATTSTLGSATSSMNMDLDRAAIVVRGLPRLPRLVEAGDFVDDDNEGWSDGWLDDQVLLRNVPDNELDEIIVIAKMSSMWSGSLQCLL